MVHTIRTPVFDRYRVEEKVGSGGMGTVYQARDVHLDRWVALKVLPPGLYEDEASVERFLREARALARLKHPGVAAVYDARVEGGFPYLVMEFVEGQTLEQLLKDEGPLPPERVVRLGIELAEALEHIHRHGVVHRDVKTSNIIINPEEQAVLADFGIAFIASLPRISQGALGTPEYMSPEQTEGHALDGRSDLYSLGVVLYECLTGTVPFAREDDSLAALTALMRSVQEAPVPPLKRHLSGVPSGVASIVEQSLSKAPEARFPSGSALALALRSAGGEPPPPAGGPLLVPSVAVLSEPVQTAAAPPAAPALEAARGVSIISHAGPVEVVAFSPDSRRLATVCGDRRIRVWEVGTGRLLHTLEGHAGRVLSVSFSPKGGLLASGDILGGVCIWDLTSGEMRQEIDGHIALAMAVVFSPDGRRLATGGADGAVRIWDVKRGRMLCTAGWHVGYVLSLAFSPDGRRLASGGADGTVHLWDAARGRMLLTLEGPEAWILAVAWSPDGTQVASGGAEGVVQIWKVPTGEPVRSLRGHAGWIMSIAYSPEGGHLVSAGRDGTVRLWETGTGSLLHRGEEHAGPVMSVAFSPDGRSIASGSSDQTVRIWRFRPHRLRKRFLLRRVARWVFAVAIAAVAWIGLGPVPPFGTAVRGPAEHGPVTLSAKPLPEPMLYGSGGLAPELGGWTLVVAVRAERGSAERIVARYRARGYRAAVLDARTGVGSPFRYRVAVGQFPHQSDAVSIRNRLAGGALPLDTWMVRLRQDF